MSFSKYMFLNIKLEFLILFHTMGPYFEQTQKTIDYLKEITNWRRGEGEVQRTHTQAFSCYPTALSQVMIFHMMLEVAKTKFGYLHEHQVKFMTPRKSSAVLISSAVFKSLIISHFWRNLYKLLCTCITCALAVFTTNMMWVYKALSKVFPVLLILR